MEKDKLGNVKRITKEILENRRYKKKKERKMEKND